MSSVINRRFWLVVVVVGVVAPAHAQNATNPARAFRQNCAADYELYCSGGPEDPLSLKRACLRQNFASLSDSCKRVLRASPAQTGEETQ